MNIIVFGAHPDDCEVKVAGVGTKWAALGHKVKFVSVTNGDKGHHKMSGGALTQRRIAESKEAGRILGVETQVLDNDDGELMPSLEVRKHMIRLIREWKAELVISHRPNDYHPDHRYTGIMVQDAAYMVTVPFVCPDVPNLDKNPVFMYMWDHFKKPNPFHADVVVSIDDVVEKKFAAFAAHESQFFEWLPWNQGYLETLQKDPDKADERLRQVLSSWFYKPMRDACAEQVEQWYGTERAASIGVVEAFELCEYGRQATEDELRKLFPFFPEKH